MDPLSELEDAFTGSLEILSGDVLLTVICRSVAEEPPDSDAVACSGFAAVSSRIDALPFWPVFAGSKEPIGLTAARRENSFRTTGKWYWWHLQLPAQLSTAYQTLRLWCYATLLSENTGITFGSSMSTVNFLSAYRLIFLTSYWPLTNQKTFFVNRSLANSWA